MAEGGASENPGAGRQHEEDGDDPVSSKQRLRRGSVADRISQQAGPLLRRFILDQAESEGVDKRPTLEDLGGQPGELTDKSISEIAQQIKIIGDELNRNAELQQVIKQLPLDSPRELFKKVACEIISDGNINWGRVVTLFYFTYKLIMRAFSHDLMDIVHTLMNWVLELIYDRVVQWIIDQGGWEGVRDYISRTNWQMVGGFAAGVLFSVAIYLVKSK
uniref:Zgc:153993 n=1 Tax=Eptatretus burgeri TaxID=7764 RepID=A0A8C4QYW9_EPTBU